MRKPFKPGESLWLSPLLGIGLALCVIHMLNGRLRPMMVELASVQVNNEVIAILGQTVQAHPLRYDDIILLEKDAAGQITALKSDMNAVNAYRAILLEDLLERAQEMRKRDMSIPLGSLTGIDFLSGRGPGVAVKVLTVEAPQSDFENRFTSAGINQTRHQVMLHITVTVSVLLPGSTIQTDVDTQLCVAETVIVGGVPENYTYFSQFDNAKDAADHYFDYGAGQ